MKLADLKNMDLLYWRGTGFWCALIRWATREHFWKFWTSAPYAHVALFWRNGAQGAYIESAPGVGVRTQAILNDPPDFAQHTHTGWDSAAFSNIIFPLLGKPYSRLSALRLYLTGNPGKGHSSFECAEVAQHILAARGWDWRGKNYHPFGLSQAVERATGNPVERLEA